MAATPAAWSRTRSMRASRSGRASSPDLDLETEGIVERIDKLERHIDSTMRDTLEAFDLSYGEYKLVMHLRYGGPPYRGKPGKLAKRSASRPGR